MKVVFNAICGYILNHDGFAWQRDLNSGYSQIKGPVGLVNHANWFIKTDSKEQFNEADFTTFLLNAVNRGFRTGGTFS